MPTFHLNKLVRTKLPKLYKELGEKARISELSGEALRRALVTKLAEEVGELASSDGDQLNELADLLQIVHDAAVAAGSSPKALEEIRQKRENDRGPMIFKDDDGVTKGYFIDTLECAEDDKWTAYYRKEPERFPEEPDNVRS